MASALGAVKQQIKYQLRRVYGKARATLRSKASIDRDFKSKYFADVPVDLLTLNEYRAEMFPKSGPYPWLDLPDAMDQIEAKLKKREITEFQAEMCRKWVKDGYIILEGAIKPERLDKIWDAYEKATECGLIKLNPESASPDDKYPGRFLNPHLKVLPLDALLRDPVFAEWNRLLIGREPIPFQTITAHKGSQQKTHSDSVHMTTYPMGYLTAAWIAFEDIHADSGPLVYYPGSHSLPYSLSHEVGIPPKLWRDTNGKPYVDTYEPFVEKLIEKEKLKPSYFHAKKGDVLFWHANLLHGGSPRKDLVHSRKSVVCHYYFKGCVCYHDIAGVQADLERKGAYGPDMTEMLM